MSGRIAIALSSAALAVAVLGVTPLGSAAGSAVQVAKDSVLTSAPSATAKEKRPIRGPRGRRGPVGPPGPRGPIARPVPKASVAFRESVDRRENEELRVSTGPPALPWRLGCDLRVR
jgi:hypothetical protein